MIARMIIAVISYSEPAVDDIPESITRQGTNRVQAVGADIRLFVVTPTAQAIDEFVTDRAFGQT
jgi:TusA-related sulfurtransferase